MGLQWCGLAELEGFFPGGASLIFRITGESGGARCTVIGGVVVLRDLFQGRSCFNVCG